MTMKHPADEAPPELPAPVAQESPLTVQDSVLYLTESVRLGAGNAMDRSDQLRRLLELTGKTLESTAPQVGMSEGNISKYLALQLLSEADKQRVREGTLGFARAYRLVCRNGARDGQESRTTRSQRGRRNGQRETVIPLGPGVWLTLSSTASVSHDSLSDALERALTRIRSDAHANGTLMGGLALSEPAG